MIQSTPTKLVALIGGSLLLFSLPAIANHIDSLDEGPFSFTGAASPLTVTGIPTVSTLGGQRYLEISTTAGSAANLSASLSPVSPGPNDDFMVFFATAGSSGNLFLEIGHAAPLNANFLEIPNFGGNQFDRVRLSFDPSQFSSVSPIVSVTLFSSSANGGAGGNATATMSFAGGMGGNVDFMYSAFTANNPTFAASAFRDIDRASFSLVGVDGGTYSIASFERNGLVIVPEPSTYVLLAVGSVGALVIARRRRVNGTA